MKPDRTIDELRHMLRMTTPRIVFCEPTNIDCVRLALEEVGLAIPIYTFNKHETAASVDELLLATGTEKDFRYVNTAPYPLIAHSL